MLPDSLDRMKAQARAALETFLDALTVPTLTTGPTQPLELTLTASLRTSGPLPMQTLEMTATPFMTCTESTVVTTGAALPVNAPVRRLEEFFAESGLECLDEILNSW